MRPAAPSSAQATIVSESTRPLWHTDHDRSGLSTKITHPLLKQPPFVRLQAAMSLSVGAAVAPHNGLELSCPAEAGSSSLLYGTLAGQANRNQVPARRVSFSELLGGAD